MKLSKLIAGLDITIEQNGNVDCEVGNLCCDSREVKPGDLFVALRGGQEQDRHDFIDDAIANGAVAVVVERPVDTGNTLQIKVENCRNILPLLASRWYRKPADQLDSVGITGTNGKTTTAFILQRILEGVGTPCGYIGTLGLIAGEGTERIQNTTPEADVLQRGLRRMVDNNKQVASIEVSSHGLSLGRVSGINFKVGVFTNFSRDHIDYHESMKSYFNAKALLFELLDRNSIAVLNFDDPKSEKIAALTKARVLGYGRLASSEFLLKNISYYSDRMIMDINTPEGVKSLATTLIGDFNCYNILAALSTAYSMEVNLDNLCGEIEKIEGIPGRFELLKMGQDFFVVIDYAHTPDALTRLLQNVRSLSKQKVLCVFGCGGDRDSGKRALMGSVSRKYADDVWVTSDNPRSEDPKKIIDEIVFGMGNISSVNREVDRSRAIHQAIAAARPGDWVVIAGKGHESEQNLGDVTIPFDDRIVAKGALCDLLER